MGHPVMHKQLLPEGEAAPTWQEGVDRLLAKLPDMLSRGDLSVNDCRVIQYLAGQQEVWVAETWSAHGEDNATLGVYVTREAAFRALKALNNMAVYVDDSGEVQARPKQERPSNERWRRGNWLPVKWGHAYPVKVQG